MQGKTYQLAEPFYVFARRRTRLSLKARIRCPKRSSIVYVPRHHRAPAATRSLASSRTTTAIQNPQLERPVSGEDLVSFQSLVRRVPVAEPVMRHALDIVRATRSKNNPDAKDYIQKWVAFGASVRAATAPCSAEGARPDKRPLPCELRRHSGAGAPSAPASHHHQLPRAVRGVTTDAIVDRLPRVNAAPAIGYVMARETHAVPGAQFMDPAVLARIGNLEPISRAVADGFINGLHKAPCTARPSTSRSIGATCWATTSAGWTGGCGRGRTATTSRRTRPRRT